MRLFLALDLPADARAAIGLWRDTLVGAHDDLRPVPDEALHVTLVFLGRRPCELVDRVWESAARAIEGLAAPILAPVTLKAVPPRRPRVLALDLEDRNAAAASAQRSLSASLRTAGLHEAEARPFWPHVTVARARGRARVRELEAMTPLDAPFTATHVTLYRSDLHPDGARYVALERMELRGLD